MDQNVKPHGEARCQITSKTRTGREIESWSTYWAGLQSLQDQEVKGENHMENANSHVRGLRLTY